MTGIGGKDGSPVYYGMSGRKDAGAMLEQSRAYALTALYSSLKNEFLLLKAYLQKTSITELQEEAE